MHGLSTLYHMNENAAAAAQANAGDPNRKLAREAAARLDEAMTHMARAMTDVLDVTEAVLDDTESATSNQGQNFLIAHHGNDYWVLPLNPAATQLAHVIIPAGTRRYGMHYILEGDIGAAVVDSLRVADAIGQEI